MEVLLTGNTMFLTKEWIEEAFPDDHVLATHRKDDMLSDTRIKSVILDSRQLLDRLYTTYDFDRIVYFSEYLLPHNNPEGELDRPGEGSGADLLFRPGERPDTAHKSIHTDADGRRALSALCKNKQDPGQGFPASLHLQHFGSWAEML